MAEVKIVDIQGVQWEMKDQTARNDIITIKEQLQTNTTAIKNISEKISTTFKAINNVKKIRMLPFNTCFASGYVEGEGAYMAVLSSHSAPKLDVIDLCGNLSKYISITSLGDFRFELSLKGPINVFGFIDEVSQN